MASANAIVKSQLQADYLTCLICTELYTDPCTLTCGHSFCKKCLLKYMKTQPAAIKARHLLCPYCRQTMPVDNPAGPVEDWVEHLKPNLILKTLLDDFGAVEVTIKGSTEMCFMCCRVSNNVQSTSWCPHCDITLCDVCAKIHIEIPASSHHVISDLSDKDKVGKRKVICKEHNCIIEYFCKDCKEVLCQKCSILYHRKCESILSTESALPDVKTYLTERRDTMLGKMDRIKLDLKEREVNIQDLESHKESLATRIAATSSQAITHIKQLEKHLMEELEEVVNRDKDKLTSAVKICQIDLQMYQQYTEFITNTLTNGGVMDMFEIYKRCQSGDVNLSVNNDAVFVKDRDIKKLYFVEKLYPSKLRTDLSLGRLVKDYLSTCTPVLQNTIDTRVDSDIIDPDPQDVVVLDVDDITTLVVTDYNSCIKSFYTRDNQQHHSKLGLGHGPHAITIIDNCKVVVSYWDKTELAVVLVTPDLVLHSTIKTGKAYTSVTALSTSTLAAGCRRPSSVDILDITGGVLKSLTSLTSSPRPLKSPDYMCTTNEGNILISDYDSESVYCVTPEGDVQFTYPCTRGVRGITTSTTGHILVVGRSNNTVIQLTGTGKFYRKLLTSRDGFVRPYGICLYGDKLYIAEQWGKVKIYRLQ